MAEYNPFNIPGMALPMGVATGPLGMANTQAVTTPEEAQRQQELLEILGSTPQMQTQPDMPPLRGGALAGAILAGLADVFAAGARAEGAPLTPGGHQQRLLGQRREQAMEAMEAANRAAAQQHEAQMRRAGVELGLQRETRKEREARAKETRETGRAILGFEKETARAIAAAAKRAQHELDMAESRRTFEAEESRLDRQTEETIARARLDQEREMVEAGLTREQREKEDERTRQAEDGFMQTYVEQDRKDFKLKYDPETNEEKKRQMLVEHRENFIAELRLSSLSPQSREILLARFDNSWRMDTAEAAAANLGLPPGVRPAEAAGPRKEMAEPAQPPVPGYSPITHLEYFAPPYFAPALTSLGAFGERVGATEPGAVMAPVDIEAANALVGAAGRTMAQIPGGPALMGQILTAPNMPLNPWALSGLPE